MNIHYKPRPVSGKMMTNSMTKSSNRWQPVVRFDAGHATIGTMMFFGKDAR